MGHNPTKHLKIIKYKKHQTLITPIDLTEMHTKKTSPQREQSKLPFNPQDISDREIRRIQANNAGMSLREDERTLRLIGVDYSSH